MSGENLSVQHLNIGVSGVFLLSSQYRRTTEGGLHCLGPHTLCSKRIESRDPGYILAYVPVALPPRYLLVLRANVGMYVKVVTYHIF